MMTPIQQAISEAGGPSAVAAVLGCSVQAVCFWRDGKRLFPHEHGAAIEQATAGKVTRRDLWPEQWHAIWPELVTPEHPAPATESAA